MDPVTCRVIILNLKANVKPTGRFTRVIQYSPDFNPIERIWLYLKQTFFTRFVARKHDELTDYLAEKLKFMQDNPLICKSICGG